MPRLVRKKPFADRVKALLNPMDFLLWLSEEIETRDWNSKLVGTQIGLAMNFAFLLARANSGRSRARDPVFEDGGSSGFFTFFVSFPPFLFLFPFSCFLSFSCSLINSYYDDDDMAMLTKQHLVL